MPDVKYVVISGYANDYAGYVAKREEYEVQQYEGAATLFGPWTEAAYEQEFARLAADLHAGRPSASHEAPLDVRGTAHVTPLGTPFDRDPPDAKFGDVVADAAGPYHRGQQVKVSFWTGNPLNAYKPTRQYAHIERMDGDQGRSVAVNGDWEVKCFWSQAVDPADRGVPLVNTSPAAFFRPQATNKKNLTAHLFTVLWDVPADATPGTYRITHLGVFKTEADGEVHEFTAHSHSFQVE